MKRIVIKVQVESERCRRKVLTVAAKSQGVRSLSLEGENRDQVVVTGDGVDAVKLTNQLRKNFYTTLISVEDMEEDEEEDEEEEEEDEEATPKENSSPPCPICTTYLQRCPLCTSFLPPSPMRSYVVYDSDTNSCTVV
ncbi:hypothetical protein DEO72_LG7g2718 [Vigna unguiculata]|uniref:HMA domain-containing protein n=1 Tax=Vigna unguiculata TaxID=3917 RepID=A0A4D6ML61_VIGUN|nr:hypothetical protein DEO72_LG7g2718 [Vigna unguiculata]